MRKELLLCAILGLAGCGEERVFTKLNWNAAAIVAAPGAKPVEVQKGGDLAGLAETRYLYRAKGQPGFQIELDGATKVEQVVLMVEQYPGSEKINAENVAMAKKAVSLLTGGDAREVDDAIKKLESNDAGAYTVEIQPDVKLEVSFIPQASILLKLQRPEWALLKAAR
nr:hypothetical protein [uncultured Pseudogulbenkiania sp.]